MKTFSNLRTLRRTTFLDTNFCLKALLSLSLALCASMTHAQSGITDTTIALGQSAPITGQAMELGIRYRDGANAYFRMVNETEGGIYGRKIILNTKDDGYEPERTADNTRKFMQEDTFALFGYVGTPTSIAALPIVAQHNIPFFAPFSGAESLREPFNRNVFHVRASYMQETEAIVKQLVESGIRRIGVVYQNDAFGEAGRDGVKQAMAKRNLQLVGTATVERNSVDVAKAVEAMKRTTPDAVIVVSAYKSVAAFIKRARIETKTQFYWSISFVGSKALINELGDDARGVLISQVMPPPWEKVNPVVKDYRRFYMRDGENSFDYTSLEGFIAAKVFVEGLRRCGAHPTRSNLVRALESMGRFDAGGFDVYFGPDRHTGSNYVDLTMISSNGKFVH